MQLCTKHVYMHTLIQSHSICFFVLASHIGNTLASLVGLDVWMAEVLQPSLPSRCAP